jgi:hypothetical protein
VAQRLFVAADDEAGVALPGKVLAEGREHLAGLASHEGKGHGRIAISNPIFHPTALYRPPGATVNHMTLYSSPAVVPEVLPFAASNGSRSARRHERMPSPPIGSGQDRSAFEYQAA